MKQEDTIALIDELIDLAIAYVESGYETEARQDFMDAREELLDAIANLNK